MPSYWQTLWTLDWSTDGGFLSTVRQRVDAAAKKAYNIRMWKSTPPSHFWLFTSLVLGGSILLLLCGLGGYAYCTGRGATTSIISTLLPSSFLSPQSPALPRRQGRRRGPIFSGDSRPPTPHPRRFDGAIYRAPQPQPSETEMTPLDQGHDVAGTYDPPE